MNERKRWWIAGLIGAASIEAVCCVGRFGLGVQAKTYTVPLTFGFRVHHGYVGAAVFLLALLAPERFRAPLRALSLALVLSDLVHHFVVLPIFTGRID